MARFFRALAIILMIISALIFIVGIINLEEPEALFIMISGFCGIVSGLALHTVGDLLDRVNYLEDKLGIYMTVENDDLPKVKCKKCRTEYDMDYPKCPCCGTKTEFNND